MKLILKGFIIGLGKIMPGVSGAMLAITLNEYDVIIESIANIKKDIYNNTKYLSKLGIGIILAIILASKIIVYCLNTHYFSTILLFIGIILNGTIKIIKKTKINKKDLLISVVIIILIILILKIFKSNDSNLNMYGKIEVIKLIIMGCLDAISSIVPGISGTALLMYFGYYNKIINTFATLSDINKALQNTYVLVPFIIGFIIGTIVISKIINKLIKEYPNTINTIVGIFMIYTLMILSVNSIKNLPNIYEIIIGITLFITTLTISIRISNKNKK